MKHNISFIAGALALVATLSGCREEMFIGEGEGTMLLETSIMSDLKVASRSLSAEQQNELCNSALIWISDPAKGLLYKFNGISSFPVEGLHLTSGHYAVEAWAGDSLPASWESKRYRGYEEFEITRGAKTHVDLTCPIRNTVVSVAYGESVAEVLSDLSLTVSLNDGITDGSHSLVYEGLNPEKGYFMLNSRTQGFTWTLEGTGLKGDKFSKSGEYKDPSISEAPYLAQTTEYIFRINYDMAGEVEIGGAYFSIEVEPEPVEGENKDILIALPPEIEGSGFDLSQPQIGEPGNIDRFAITITASSALEKVMIAGSLLEIVGLYPDYELMGMEAEHLTALSDKGFTIQQFRQIEGSDAITNVRLIMEKEFFADIPQGDYSLTISASDAEGLENSSEFSISINDAPVLPGSNPSTDLSTLGYTTATFSATVKDPSAISQLGFEVMRVSRAYEDWTFIEGTVQGNNLTATVTDLEEGATYQWRVVADAYRSKEQTFTTPAYPQIPNGGFEDWQSGSPALLYAKGGTMFWDSGNHGSSTMKKNITNPDATVKHSGQYSAQLKSQFVGVGSFGKFAAGNAFVGQYLDTDGTDGILGWGREWDPEARPKALHGWVKYSPGTVASNVANAASSAPADIKAEFPAGAKDKGIIYVALVDNSNASTYKDSSWPVIIRTKSSNQQLFDKNGSYVKAYGEQLFAEATPGDDLIEFTIPLNEVNPGDFSHVIIVCSASKAGDYFLGGEGSTLWIDDLEFIY